MPGATWLFPQLIKRKKWIHQKAHDATAVREDANVRRNKTTMASHGMSFSHIYLITSGNGWTQAKNTRISLFNLIIH
jgi:hypothetical protein